MQVTATSTARLEMLFDDLAVDASTLDSTPKLVYGIPVLMNLRT